MDKIFFVGMIIGLTSRLIMLNLDQKQYPSQPNILVSQTVLAIVASSLGALLIPALMNRSYTSITFLSLAAEQFRQVRSNRRDTLQSLEETQLIKRGNSYIEEIARTYEVRNYMCIVTSFLTVALFYILSGEFNIDDNTGIIISAIAGICITLILKKLLLRKSIGDIAEVSIVDISFVNETILKVGSLQGITNIGLKTDRERYLKDGIGIEIKPKDDSYENAGVLNYPGQREAICYNVYSRLGVLREDDEPVFTPIPRKDPNTQSIFVTFIPIEKDEQKVIEAVKSCPILASSKGKNISLKDLKILRKENE
ncbi:YIEGIA domain-containing protein [Terrisporobacter sp.]